MNINLIIFAHAIVSEVRQSELAIKEREKISMSLISLDWARIKKLNQRVEYELKNLHCIFNTNNLNFEKVLQRAAE